MPNPIYDLSSPMSLATTLAVYEDWRPVMPEFVNQAKDTPLHAEKLSDLFDEFDAVLLDGFGVLNVGPDAIVGAAAMLDLAREKNVTAMVLTNGASKDKATAGQKYSTLGLPIAPDDVISSRDALLHHLSHQNKFSCFGVIDSFTDIPTPQDVGFDIEMKALSPDAPQDWLSCDAIGFFGAVNWTPSWQEALMAAIKNNIPIMMANPDVAAPHPHGFSREPGFWIAKALHDLDIPTGNASVEWFGKPYPSVYDLALDRLEHRMGQSILDRKRIAMVGDTLHTDILGGQSAGLSTVLVTDHGLFRDGDAEETMKTVGITPDYIVKTV